MQRIHKSAWLRFNFLSREKKDRKKREELMPFFVYFDHIDHKDLHGVDSDNKNIQKLIYFPLFMIFNFAQSGKGGSITECIKQSKSKRSALYAQINGGGWRILLNLLKS